MHKLEDLLGRGIPASLWLLAGVQKNARRNESR